MSNPPKSVSCRLSEKPSIPTQCCQQQCPAGCSTRLCSDQAAHVAAQYITTFTTIIKPTAPTDAGSLGSRDKQTPTGTLGTSPGAAVQCLCLAILLVADCRLEEATCSGCWLHVVHHKSDTLGVFLACSSHCWCAATNFAGCFAVSTLLCNASTLGGAAVDVIHLDAPVEHYNPFCGVEDRAKRQNKAMVSVNLVLSGSSCRL